MPPTPDQNAIRFEDYFTIQEKVFTKVQRFTIDSPSEQKLRA